jgi:hypothetical protein
MSVKIEAIPNKETKKETKPKEVRLGLGSIEDSIEELQKSIEKLVNCLVPIINPQAQFDTKEIAGQPVSTNCDLANCMFNLSGKIRDVYNTVYEIIENIQI